MNIKKRESALAALLIILSQLPALGAPLTLDKRDYKLTYPDGWAISPFLPTTDTTSMVTREPGGAISWTHGQAGVTEASAAQIVASLTRVYRQGYVRTDSSVKTMGGKPFITLGWKDTAAGDSTGRMRSYALLQGAFLFASWVAYDSPDGDGALADVEAALASLEIKATGIHRTAWNRRGHQARARVDVLGRTWRPGFGAIPKGPLFPRR